MVAKRFQSGSSSMFDRLKAPFDPSRVSWRVGSTTSDKKRGLAFAYIDARDVMERLDDVCTPSGWQNKYTHANGKTVCDIGIKIGEEWIWKADGSGDTDVEAEKGALSDAFKRAAVRWGIGRYLYDVATPWVEIEPAGKSFKIKEAEIAKLTKALGTAPMPDVAPKNNLLSEPAATQVAGNLKDDINGCVSLAELDKFIRSDEFKHRYGSLPEKHRNQVRSHGQTRRHTLEERDAA